MMLLIIFLTSLLWTWQPMIPAGLPATGQLEVVVENIEDNTGEIIVAVFREKDRFLKEDYVLKKVSVSNYSDRVVVAFQSLPFDTYAISAFHDLNGNEELDRRLGIIPREPYGFSDEKDRITGIPSFSKCAFLFSEDGQKVRVSLRRL